MSKRSVRIERLEIRLRGVSAEAARAAAGRLGGALLEELSRGPGADAAGGAARGGQGGARRASDELHRVVARKVAASVRGRLK